MPIVNFSSISRGDAISYRNILASREAGMLANLSGWLHATNGPWADFDGSLDGLTSAWDWFLDFQRARCPGIPVGSTPLRWVDHGAPVPGDLVKSYAIEALAHYVMVVCRRFDTGATWSVCLKPKSSMFYHESGISLGNGAFFVPHNFLSNMTAVALRAAPGTPRSFLESTALREVLPKHTGMDFPSQQRGVGLLPNPQPVPFPHPIQWAPRRSSGVCPVVSPVPDVDSTREGEGFVPIVVPIGLLLPRTTGPPLRLECALTMTAH